MSERHRVLIVDDERAFRLGIQRLFARRFPTWEIVGSATCAQEALDFLDQRQVDLMITDIKMPGLSGLELIERIRRLPYELEMIIISGYDDFQFAKKAMLNRVFYYLLKPLDELELDTVLKEIEAKLQTQGDGKGREALSTEYVNSVINEILNDKIEANRYLASFFPQIANGYHLLCIDMDMSGATLPGDAPDDLDYLSHMREFLKSACRSHCPDSLVFFRSKLLWGIITGTDGCASVTALAQALRGALQGKFHIAASVGIATCRQPDERFSACFQRAYIAAKAKLVLPDRTICRFEELHLHEELPADDKLEGKLVNCIRACRREESLAVLGALLTRVLQERPDAFALTRYIRRITYSIFCAVDKARLLNQEFVDAFDSLQDLQSISSMEQLRQMATGLVAQAVGLFETMERNRHNRVVESTIQYIDEHYAQDLSLQQLAELAGINANYLCTLFKAETDMIIIEYTTFVRMEKAKNLLRCDNSRLADIARQIGYKDEKYFMRIFKRSIGVTPAEFRKYSRAT